jgi:metal-sulfur cluster biosynthetic enzyme
MANLAREEEIREALWNGLGHEVGIDIADLGLIKEIIISNDNKIEVDNGG